MPLGKLGGDHVIIMAVELMAVELMARAKQVTGAVLGPTRLVCVG